VVHELDVDAAALAERHLQRVQDKVMLGRCVSDCSSIGGFG
jgi:hypothetical protein